MTIISEPIYAAVTENFEFLDEPKLENVAPEMDGSSEPTPATETVVKGARLNRPGAVILEAIPRATNYWGRSFGRGQDTTYRRLEDIMTREVFSKLYQVVFES
jgi:hypothetical protein